MATAKWMWGDALTGHAAARLNPLRWSRSQSLEELAADLEHWCAGHPEDKHRPVRVQLRGPGDHAQERQHPSIDAAVSALRADREGLPSGRPSEAGGTSRPPSKEPQAAPPSSAKGQAFRCTDRTKIPDDLLDGPFEDFEIACDVYATAYLIARNATPEMYTINPFKNPQVRIVWRYIFFIIFSQLFIVSMLTFVYPPSTSSQSWHVDCRNTTSLAMLVARGVLSSPDTQECQEAGKFAFEADLRGTTVQYYEVEHGVPFYDSILVEGSVMIYVLRIICCTWQFSQMYLDHFSSIRNLLEYHDFSRWFLVVKGEQVRNGWAIGIPLVQYGVLLVVTTVSFAVLCAQDEAFDIVMNSLAFTFIAEAGKYFNAPLAKNLAATKIEPKPYGLDMFYLYPEYSESNAVGEDGTYTDGGWYICEDETGKAGLLCDYKARHNPDKYPHKSEPLIRALERALLLVPILAVVMGAVRSHAIKAAGASAQGEL